MGLSRSCALLLTAYFLLSLGLQQALPPGETLIYTPFGMGVWPTLLPLFLIMNAITQEVRRPKIAFTSRVYWQDFAFTILSGLLFFSFCLSFGYLKSLIPVFHPYYLDPLLQRLDMALHGGTAPMQWFQHLLTPHVANLLGNAYLVSWLSVISLYYLWQMLLPPSLARSQFISSFYLLWIIGGIGLAMLASSVGPVYYSLFYHDAYSVMNAAFTHHLYDATAAAENFHGISARQLLIDLQDSRTVANINGMSAMPSMHVGSALLIALHSYRYARRLAWFTIPFAMFIFITSVALGWHYALDGYGAGFCVAFIWWLTRYDLRQMRPPKDQPSSE